MAKKRANPIPALLPKLFSLVFAAALAYGAYLGWGLHIAYDKGYAAGLTEGTRMMDYIRSQNLEGKRFFDFKSEHVKAGLTDCPGSTWKDNLWRQGYVSGINYKLRLWH